MSGLAPVLENESLVLGGSEGAFSLLTADGKMAPEQHNGVNSGVRLNGFENIPRPFFIGVAGGTASGKSTVCQRITECLGLDEIKDQKQVVVISQKDFYKPLNPEQLEKAQRGQYNFDHPSAFDDELMVRILQDLKSGHTVKIPRYDSVKYQTIKDSYKVVHSADVIVFEGILVFYFPKIRDFFNMKLFVDTDADTRLSRRVKTDLQEKGRDLEQVLHHYTTFVKPAFEEFCLPTKKYADVIIPRGADNTVAIELIVQHIQELLRPSKSGYHRFRQSSESLVSNRPH